MADHTYFELGMLYFLSHDAAVPQKVRDHFNGYGLCADEFEEFGHIPPQLYIRESNRLVGDFVMTQNTIAKPRWRPDSIAVAHWWLDKHMTGKYAVPTGVAGEEMYVQLEGNFPKGPGTNPPPYDVPFSLMVPKRGTGANLLVPVCLSVSSAAFASTRIETMLMSVGSAAGVAAQQLVSGAVSAVQDVNITIVQEVLVRTFQQEIHVDSPAPIPTAQYYNVSGAGSAAWNGHYTLAPDSEGAVYTMASAGCPNGEACSLYSYQGVWRLASQGKEVFYTADGPGAATGSSQPPLVGWRALNGAAPAPTLAAGPHMA